MVLPVPSGALLVEKCLEPHDAADLEITPKEISDEDGMLLETWSARFSTR